MRARTALAALVLALILPAASGPSPADASTMDQPPQAIVSAGWAGIWQVDEETRDCSTGALISTASYLDTLCAGKEFFLLPGLYLTRGGYVYATCSGAGFTDTTLDLTCSVGGICGCLGTCSSLTTKEAHWTRNGDQATTVLTTTVEFFAPGGCAPPNVCRRTTGTRTRISNETPACDSSSARTIMATAGPHGSISPNGAVTVPSGGTQAFTITPDPGYSTASVVVDGAEVGAVASYAFTNVTANHTIAATFALMMGFVFKPQHLHLNLNEKYLTGYLTPPAPYDLLQIDVPSIRLNGSVPIAPGTDATIVSGSLKVKFLRSQLAPTLTIGSDVPVTVTGTIAGEPFAGTDLIDVSAPKVLLASTTLTAGTTTDVRWDVPDASTPTVTLLSTFDGGSSWNIEAEDILNTGQYTWTVPDLTTDDARLAVIQIYATDETGVITESEWSVSDPFSISNTLGVGGQAAAFALRPENPSAGSLAVRFSLPSDAQATLAVYDVGGRQASTRKVVGVGWHTVSLDRLPAGVYVVRLTQGGRSLSTPVVVVR